MATITSVSPRPRARLRKRRAHLVPVLISAAIGAAAVVSVSYLLWPTWTPVEANDPSHLPISVGKTLFKVPVESVRMKVQQHSGPQDRVDLSFPYASPDGEGDRSQHINAGTIDEKLQSIKLIFLSIAAHNDLMAPDERARTIYPRYLETATAEPVDGLGVRAFRDNTPYANEDLFFATSPELLTRCTRDGETPGMCLSERRIDGADLTFRFPRSWLGNWRNITNAMDRIVAQIYKAPG